MRATSEEIDFMNLIGQFDPDEPLFCSREMAYQGLRKASGKDFPMDAFDAWEEWLVGFLKKDDSWLYRPIRYEDRSELFFFVLVGSPIHTGATRFDTKEKVHAELKNLSGETYSINDISSWHRWLMEHLKRIGKYKAWRWEREYAGHLEKWIREANLPASDQSE